MISISRICQLPLLMLASRSSLCQICLLLDSLCRCQLEPPVWILHSAHHDPQYSRYLFAKQMNADEKGHREVSFYQMCPRRNDVKVEIYVFVRKGTHQVQSIIDRYRVQQFVRHFVRFYGMRMMLTNVIKLHIRRINVVYQSKDIFPPIR